MANNAPSYARKLRPVRAKLKFHRNAGHDAEQEINSEDPRPESRRLAIALVFAAQRDSF